MFWPRNLAVFYPLPPDWRPDALMVAAAVVVLAGVSAFSIRYVKQAPYLLTGWLWYLGTLVPVIGLVQVGSQAVADRYTYIPYVGIFIMLAWGAVHLFDARHWNRKALGFAPAILVGLAAVSFVQAGYWKNAETLWTHTMDVTEDNPLARNNYGEYLRRQGRLEEAVHQFSEAVRIHPGYVDAHVNLGRALAEKGAFDEAVEQYAEALKRNPKHFNAHNNMANALARMGAYEQAIVHYKTCLQLEPDSWLVYGNLGSLRFLQGKYAEAEQMYRSALEKNPEYVDAHVNLAVTLTRRNKRKEAAHHYQKALQFEPGNMRAKSGLETLTEGIKKGSS